MNAAKCVMHTPELMDIISSYIHPYIYNCHSYITDSALAEYNLSESNISESVKGAEESKNIIFSAFGNQYEHVEFISCDKSSRHKKQLVCFIDTVSQSRRNRYIHITNNLFDKYIIEKMVDCSLILEKIECRLAEVISIVPNFSIFSGDFKIYCKCHYIGLLQSNWYVANLSGVKYTSDGSIIECTNHSFGKESCNDYDDNHIYSHLFNYGW